VRLNKTPQNFMFVFRAIMSMLWWFARQNGKDEWQASPHAASSIEGAILQAFDSFRRRHAVRGITAGNGETVVYV